MAENSKIGWTTHTFNPWTGCTKVSPGCANCYAEGWSKRSGIVKWGKGESRRRTSAANWREPLKWNREAKCQFDTDGDGNCHHHPNGCPRPRVFCASLADWLDDEVPIEWLADLLQLIHETPNLDWQLLTKRPENWRRRMGDDDNGVFGCARNMENSSMPGSRGWELMEFVGSWLNGSPPANVWIGTTVENQEMAEKRIPMLLSIPAKVRFLSCEPLLGPLDLQYPETLFPGGPRGCCSGHDCGCMGLPIDPPLIWGINWVITGGESGPKARPADLEWFRGLRSQCQAANVAYFMKQLGGVRDAQHDIERFPEDLRIREFPVSHVPSPAI